MTIFYRLVYSSPISVSALLFVFWGIASEDLITVFGMTLVFLSTMGIVFGGEA